MVDSPHTPFVSVVIPIRNEERFIARTLDRILNEDYPADRLEIIVADGMSDDATRQIVAAYVRRDARVRLIDNPERVTPCGLNAAIRASCGEIVCRIDGHCEVASDVVSQNVRLLQEHPEAWIVGGPIVHGATSLRGSAVAIAMSHPFGVGTARHRFAGFEGYSDTVQFPAFRRWVFDRVGLFDTTLVRNQDDEFNYRVVRAGGRIFVSPHVRYVYYVRDSLTNLFRHYFQYGFWRIPVIRKHKKPTSVRQIIPLLFFLAAVGLGAAGLLLRQPMLALALPSVYTFAMLLLGVSVVRRAGLRVATLVPVAVVIMHVAYALGMACGLSAALLRVRAWEEKGAMASLSR